MAKRIKKLRKKIQEKTTEKKKSASKRRVKKKAKKNRRQRKVSKAKKKITKPLSGAKGLGGDVKELTKAQAEALRARVPGSSSKSTESVKDAGADTAGMDAARKEATGGDDELTTRDRKILRAQQLRNEGLTTKQVASAVDMSPSWVSSNTATPDASKTPEASDDLEQSTDGVLGAVQSMEDQLFGFDDLDDAAEGDRLIDIDLGEVEDDLDIGADIDEQFGDLE